MISAKSFDKTLYNKLKLIITIQKYFSKLASDNINDIGSKILFLNDIAKSQSGISILAQCFRDESDFHPKNIENLADLFIFFVDKTDSSNFFHLLKKFTVSCIRKSDKVRSSFLFFLRTLLNRNVITIDLIIEEISLMLPIFTKKTKEEQTESKNEKELINNESDFVMENENFNGKLAELNHDRFREKKFKVIDWFFPEICASNPKFASKLQNDLHYAFYNQFKTNDFSSILPIMNSGYSEEKIAQIIRKDDIDSFTQIVSEVGEMFDFNQTIKSTKYERCVLLKTKPTLIQYASYFCSVKIFKFLYLNKADITTVCKNMYTIVDFAVSGGCSEIIHILSQNGVNFLTGIPISIQFFQNDIFQWLIENCAPKSEEDFKEMNYYACNINKRLMYRFRYLISLNHQMDDTEFDYYQQKDYNGKVNDPIRKVFVRKTYPQHESSDYSDSYVIVNTSKEEEEDKSDEFFSDDFFKFFDFDLLFESIIDSNNYLSLFLLFDHGMSINACNEKSKKTLLHYAIQKGKSFLIDLLLSNDLIDVSLQDKNDQTPIVYAVKYARSNVFFKMIKMQKVIDALNDHDCIQIAFYAKYLELNEINEYLKNIWSINLIYLMEIDDIKNFADAITYLPLNFLKEQIENALIESFKSRHFEYFSILASRILKEKNVSFLAKFYFVPKSQNKNGREGYKEFARLFQLLSYYMGCFLRNSNFIDFYKLFIKDLYRELSKGIDYENSNQFVNGNRFFVSSGKNTIYVFFVKDQSEIQNIEIKIQFLS